MPSRQPSAAASSAAAGWERLSFGPRPVGVVHAVQVQTPTTRRRLGLALAAVLAALTTAAPAHAATSNCTETLGLANMAALKPADVLLAISTPRAGETLANIAPTDSVAFSVDYWGPRLLSADSAHAVDDYHLVFILDEDAAPYIGTLQPLPVCDSHVVHSATTRVTIDNVLHGSHALAVLLVGSNNVSVNPPVAARVTFTVR